MPTKSFSKNLQRESTVHGVAGQWRLVVSVVVLLLLLMYAPPMLFSVISLLLSVASCDSQLNFNQIPYSKWCELASKVLWTCQTICFILVDAMKRTKQYLRPMLCGGCPPFVFSLFFFHYLSASVLFVDDVVSTTNVCAWCWCRCAIVQRSFGSNNFFSGESIHYFLFFIVSPLKSGSTSTHIHTTQFLSWPLITIVCWYKMV